MKTSSAQLKAVRKYREKNKDRDAYMTYRSKAFAIITPKTERQKSIVDAAVNYRTDLLKLKSAIDKRLKEI